MKAVTIQQGGLVTGAKVSGRDLSPSAGVTCHMATQDPFDMSGSFGAGVSTGNTLPAPATSFTSGSKVVHCTLSPGSASVGWAVGSYVVTEVWLDPTAPQRFMVNLGSPPSITAASTAPTKPPAR